MRISQPSPWRQEKRQASATLVGGSESRTLSGMEGLLWDQGPPACHCANGGRVGVGPGVSLHLTSTGKFKYPLREGTGKVVLQCLSLTRTFGRYIKLGGMSCIFTNVTLICWDEHELPLCPGVKPRLLFLLQANPWWSRCTVAIDAPSLHINHLMLTLPA